MLSSSSMQGPAPSTTTKGAPPAPPRHLLPKTNMLFGSIIGKWVSDDWFTDKPAQVLFAASAAVIILVTVAIFEFDLFSQTAESLLHRLFLGCVGVLAPTAVFLLWDGMRQFWLRCDRSSKTRRRFSFLLMLIGLWYGALLYYLIVYLPHIRSDWRKLAEKGTS